MRYVRRVLQPGETVVYATRLHPVIYWRAILLLIVAIILAAAAWHTANQNLGLALGIAAAIFALLALSSALRAAGIPFYPSTERAMRASWSQAA